MPGKPIVIDCDPGHDDAVALLLAAGSPAVDLRAVTTTFGNCSIGDSTRNALQILTLAGVTDVPVAAGAAGPLSGAATLGNYVHGASGLDGPPMPEPGFAPVDEDAVALLTRVLRGGSGSGSEPVSGTGYDGRAASEKITIAATGPITNIARLLTESPDVVDHIAEIVFMGGSTERGNHTPTAEFNTYADPEALDIVLRSGLPIRMVGLNLTHQALATPSIVERMRAMDHVIGRTCAAWMGFFGGSYHDVWEFDAPPVHDPCVIAAIIDPTIIAWRDSFVTVELDGTWTRGTTVVDLFGRYPDQEPNVSVAMTLDADRYWNMVLDAVDALGRA